MKNRITFFLNVMELVLPLNAMLELMCKLSRNINIQARFVDDVKYS